MKTLDGYLSMIKPVDGAVLEGVQKRLDSQTKPRGSLGRLESFCRQLASVQGRVDPKCEKKIIFTLAGDHGVVDEGVSAYPQTVTGQMVLNFVNGGAGVNVLAKHAGCEVIVVDMGVASDLDFGGFVDKKIDFGTRNFTQGPAMTREQAERSIVTGIELALDNDFDILGTGDMGIGNTTPSAAIASVIMEVDVEDVTGRGTGINDETLMLKIDAIKRGISVNRPDKNDPVDVLSKVGGFEIGGIAGLIIGAAIKKRLAVVDGFISTAGALIAGSFRKEISDYFIVSHLSAEKGHDLFVKYLKKDPVLDLGMRLGEGTGAALAIEIIDAALRLYHDMATFNEAGVDDKPGE
jgi:nicotinate-nucleotide--dimethylbenzimidazole phosphoribosyltransferase